MTVGVQINRNQLDSAMAQLALQTLAYFRVVEDLASWAANITQAELEAVPYGYTADEAFAILSVIGRLTEGGTWLAGGAVPPEVHNTLADLAKFQGLGTAQT